MDAKRDTFLKGINAVIQALEKPTIVSAEKFKEAQEQYQAALNEITERDQEIEELKKQIGDLEKCKDAAQVKGSRA